MTDPYERPDVQAYFEHVRAEVLPAMRGSAVAMTLYEPGDIDPRMALELGAMILMDKPIIVTAPPGAKIPEHLARVADRIVESDMNDPSKTAARIADSLSTFGLS